MKHFLLPFSALVALLCGIHLLPAADAVEVFNYPAGTPLAEIKSSESDGWMGGWGPVPGSKEQLSPALEIVEGSLKSPAFESKGLRSETNRLALTDLAQGALFSRELPQPIDFRSDEVFYISFLCKWAQNHPNEAARVRIEDPDGLTFAGLAADGATPNAMVLRTRMNGQDTARSTASFPAGEVLFSNSSAKT